MLLEEWIATYGYPIIFIATFLEGETVVILAGIAAFQGYLNPVGVCVSALVGSFLCDQVVYAIGRRYGAALLKRFSWLERRAARALRLTRKYETLFILSFRFMYGVRMIAACVIALAGVKRPKFMILNFIAAVIWAVAFTAGGYYFGQALLLFLSGYQKLALYVLAVVAVVVGIVSLIRRLLKQRDDRKKLPDWDNAT